MHATPVLVVKVISTKSVVNVTFGFGLTGLSISLEITPD